MTRKEWDKTVEHLTALAVGEEYPVTLRDGSVTVAREGEAEWVVSVSIASHPAGVYTASETVDNIHGVIGAVGALV